MKFKEMVVNLDLRFSLGFEEDTNSYYLAIPVSNSIVDYEEHYRISKNDFDKFASDDAEGALFAEECRKRRHDALLFFPPGKDRGLPL